LRSALAPKSGAKPIGSDKTPGRENLPGVLCFLGREVMPIELALNKGRVAVEIVTKDIQRGAIEQEEDIL
jgi:hypothetical protein